VVTMNSHGVDVTGTGYWFDFGVSFDTQYVL